MRLWLDDVREPWKHGFILCEWARTADEAIELLKKGDITLASLDHDLAPEHYVAGTGTHDSCGDNCGCAVVKWMEANNVWPKNGVVVHSMNPAGRQRMQQVIDRHYRPGNMMRCGVCNEYQHLPGCSNRYR